MTRKVAEGIKRGLEEAVAFARGEAGRSTYRVTRVAVPDEIDVKAIRRKLRLSQRDFAAQFGFSIDTLRHWEQGLRRPRGPARVLLLVIDRAPEAVQKALHAV